LGRSEFTLIDAFTAELSPARAPAGPGDDCAVLRGRPGRELCVTTDAVVEDVHFTRRGFRLEDVGHKALAVNLSDLAAMGARPTWFLCALGLPRGFTLAEARRLGRGMAALAREHRIALAGGNVTSARELSVTVTAAGEVARGRALLRSGGRAGDLLYVSGTLGDARLGLALLEEGQGRGSPAVGRQRRPEPRVRLGLLAGSWARAAIDVSDGLGQDLGHLCAASGVGAEVELARVPVSAELLGRLGDAERAALFAVAGGEDYELVLAVPPRRARAFEQACARVGERVTRIGVLAEGQKVRLRARSGRNLPPPHGFDHLGLSASGQAAPGPHLTPPGSRAK
jgi:thiamine-monophosphate kinase